MKQLALDIAPPPAPALENFVPGRNAEVVVALYALANAASSERFVYLWGGAGSGRSHLLRAVVTAARGNGLRAEWFDARHSVDAAADDIVWAADDVHQLDAVGQIALFSLHNRVHAGGGALIASGNAAPAQLALRADLTTRLASGLIYHVHGLDDGEKAAALGQHASARGFQLPQEVVDYLLRHAQRDLPSLLALLEALDRYSLETKRAITVPLLRELLAASPESGSPR